MIEITIPGHATLRLNHLVLDYNGTLACDGTLLAGVRERLIALAPRLGVHVITADTFGTAQAALTGIPCRVKIMHPVGQDVDKLEYIAQLGRKNVAAIGNGRNDRLMLQAAGLGIAVIGPGVRRRRSAGRRRHRRAQHPGRARPPAEPAAPGRDAAFVGQEPGVRDRGQGQGTASKDSIRRFTDSPFAICDLRFACIAVCYSPGGFMLPKTADVVVIGGGVMGASAAYHLAARGCKNVVLLEKAPFLGMEATGKCAGGIRYQFSTEINVRLSLLSLPMLERFEEELGQAIDLRWPGYLFLLDNDHDLAVFRSNVAMQNRLGMPSHILAPAEAAARAPLLDMDGIIAAGWHDRRRPGRSQRRGAGLRRRRAAPGRADLHWGRGHRHPRRGRTAWPRSRRRRAPSPPVT